MFPRTYHLFVFTLPLIAGQLGQIFFGIGDIMVAGRYSTDVVAALGISQGLFAPFLMVGLGTTYAVGPLSARIRGEERDSSRVVASSLLVALIVSAVMWFLMALMITRLDLFGFDPKLEKLIAVYLKLVIPSMLPILIFQVLKEYLQAYDDTFFANGSIIFFNLFNVATNAILMFGLLGFPELGIKGAAITTVLARTLMALSLLVYTLKKLPFRFQVAKEEMRQVIELGVPIGLATLVEVLAWSVTTVFIGKMSVTAAAAHNIVLNLASMTFMIPVALGSAAAVKVGNEFGKGNLGELHQWGKSAILISVIYMILTALSYLIFPQLIVRFATDEATLIGAAANLLFFVAVFQIPDGIQVTLQGVLRGIGVTKVPMLLVLAAYWLIGLPIGYYFAFYGGMQAKGIWLGLAIGLYALSVALIILYVYKTRRLRASTS